ncbi:MAG: UDP-N-acetylmuramoyl-L-alanine--D-glutamate ligase [Planctomycetes bacterium]|nr:UDP-N-acetylmuramoyl-L-alanine--D-glutamate ligase [Planctomycetota bacterium]
MWTNERLDGVGRVTVMGLGRFGGGAGAARFFAARGAKVTVTDLAGADRLAESVASLAGRDIRFVLGNHHPDDFRDTDLIVANQAVRPDHPLLAVAREAGVPIATETGLALALNRSPWIGVTGSSGKSTTAALIANILTEHDPDTLFGGNIGGDLLTRVENRPHQSPLVVELSSFQLQWLGEDFAACLPPPRFAVVTNLTANHLDWHRDLEEYAAAKRQIIHHLRPGDWAVLNHDDPALRQWEDGTQGRVVRCGWRDPGGPDAGWVDGDRVVLRLDGVVRFRFPVDRFRLLGRHNLRNAVAAVAAAWPLVPDPDPVTRGLSAFTGLPHRLETVGTSRERVFINDSKATTPEATVTALESLNVPVILIAGGYDKGSPFEALGQAVQRRAHGVVLLGVAAGRILEAIQAASGVRPRELPPLAIREASGNFADAVRQALDLAPAGGAVLLSPACASWDMFANYEERGEAFRGMVNRLGALC